MQEALEKSKKVLPQDKGRIKALWGKSRPVLHLGRQLTNDRLEMISQACLDPAFKF